MTPRDDDLLLRASALPRNDVTADVAAAIRGAALGRLRESPRESHAAVRFTRSFETAFVLASVVAYLGWTAATFASLSELRSRGVARAAAAAPSPLR